MLQECQGIKPFEGIPNVDSIIAYKKNDILVSNIRPYLQKIWLADKDGGCNPDVLVIRVNDVNNFIPKFVYYSLRRKEFFDNMMQGISGVKMPRGDKNNNLNFEIPSVSLEKQKEILSLVDEFETNIHSMQQQLYQLQNRKVLLVQKSLFG